VSSPPQPSRGDGPAHAVRPGPAGPAADAGPSRPPDLYRSMVALVVWWVWVVFAAANIIDLAVQGHNHFSAVVIAILVLITGVAFVTAFRPRITADDEAMTIRNPLRDHRVPWGCVQSLELGDSLEVRCRWQDDRPRHKKLYGWAVHSPRRSRLKAEMRAGRKLAAAERRSTSAGQPPPEARSAMTKTDAEHIVASLRARADKARAAGAEGGRPVSRWDALAVAALVVPAAAALAVALT
jgi:hypothetical protein